MQKIKVLHVIKSLGRGGAEMLLPETLKEHNKEKFEFHYIYFLPWKNQLVKEIENADGIVTCVSSKNNIQLIFQYKKIIKYCKVNNIDLIHAHLPWAGFVSRIVFKLTKIPTIYTEHNLQERYHIITKLINKTTFNWQSLGICVSDGVLQSIKKEIKPTIPFKTICNGVNTNYFVRNKETSNFNLKKQFKIPEDSILVGTVAVFRFQKRLDLWLEILKVATDNNSKIYGIIVGAGPLEKELFKKHKELNLEGKVFFTGLQTNVRPYFETMDIFMMTSSFEGLPIALLEAMSMNCAILSTDAGGIKEVIRKNVDGVLVGVNDYVKLVDELLTLAGNKAKIENYQFQARKRVTEMFSIKSMINSLEEEYYNIIKS